jgi:hypothetical protein
MATSPLQSPEQYDYITLDGVKSPGLCIRSSGGERKQKWENQQAPGFAGAFTVFRGEEISTIEYQFQLWEPEHFIAWDSFVATLRAGQKKRPPRVYDLVDLTIDHNEIKQVAAVSIGRQEKLGPTKWGYTVAFTEYRKRKPIGGVPLPKGKTEIEQKIERLNSENKALGQQLDARLAAVRKERGQ